MENNYKEVLLNTCIAISDSVLGLKDIAYAKLLFFVLYLENKHLTEREIKKSAATILNSISIPDESLRNALNLLKARRLIIEDKTGFFVIETERNKVDGQLRYSNDMSQKICEKYFSTQIDGKILKCWFNEVNNQYFSTFADKLIELYNNKKSLVLDVEMILSPLILKFKLEKYKENLIQGYREFLLSSDIEEKQKIWNMMQSLLAAKIVSADISPDLLSIEEYKNSDIILDTNILFANSLISPENLDETIQSFGKIAKNLGSRLYVTQETIGEYQRVCSRSREETVKIYTVYSEKVLSGAKNRNSFLRTLRESHCEKKEDIERFFDFIGNLPSRIGDSELKILDKGEYEDVAYDRHRDRKLYEEIRNIWSEFHVYGYTKKDETIVHDLVLTKICQKLINKKKIFILTLDISLEALSLKWVNDKEEPIWRSLFSLVQILAINGGGPNFNPKDIAPLVRIFMEQEDLGRSDKYDERDMLFLSDLSNRVNELPDTNVISLLNRVHKARMLSSGKEQAIKDIRLELERSLFKKDHDLDETISEKDAKIFKLEKENASYKERVVWLRFIILAILYMMVSYAIFIYLGGELMTYWNSDSRINIYQIVLFILTPQFRIVPEYRKAVGSLKIIRGGNFNL